MFYFKEVYLRTFFVAAVFTTLVLLFYNKKNAIFYLVLKPITFFNENNLKNFIYTHPTEVLCALINVIGLFVTIVCILYILFTTLDFLKPSLTKKEYAFIIGALFYFVVILTVVNILALFFVFPLFFRFFTSFNAFESKILVLELKIENYLLFIFNFLYIVNLTALTIITTYTLLIIKGVITFLRLKKTLVMLNLLLATFISPPDVAIQIILFLTLQLLVELLQLSLLYTQVFNKEVS